MPVEVLVRFVLIARAGVFLPIARANAPRGADALLLNVCSFVAPQVQLWV